MMQCRSCLDTKAAKFVPMNKTVRDDMNLYDYFNECTQLNAMVDDELPPTLCFSCSQNLLTAFSFIQISRQADQTLRLYLEQELYGEDQDTKPALIKEELLEPSNEEVKYEKLKIEVNESVDPLEVAPLELEFFEHSDDKRKRSISSESIGNEIADDNAMSVDSNTSHSDQGDYEDDDTTATASLDSSQKLSKKKYSSTFACMCCDAVFHKKYKLKVHLQKAHRTKLLCKKCPKLFEFPKELQVHNSLVHSQSSPVKCQYCPETPLITRNLLAQHFRLKHCSRYHKYFPVQRRKGIGQRTPFLCEVCRQYFPSASALCIHQQSHTVEPYSCPYCAMEFKTQHALDAHQQQKHSDVYAAEQRSRLNDASDLPCPDCSRIFKTEYALQAHREGFHLERQPRTICTICNKEMNVNYLSTHMKQIHTEPRKFVCDICGNPFKGASQLHTHKKLHMQRDFECTVCHKLYTRQSDLTVHMRTHTGEQPYECHLCDKKFAMKVRLTYHLQMHAGIKHRCKECGKELCSLQSLKDHMYKHNGMPYRCEYCDYGNVMRETFARHMHTKHDVTMSIEELNLMFKINTGRLPHIPATVEV